MNPHVRLLFGALIGRSVDHDFLKRREFTLPCSYRSTCFHSSFSTLFVHGKTCFFISYPKFQTYNWEITAHWDRIMGDQKSQKLQSIHRYIYNIISMQYAYIWINFMAANNYFSHNLRKLEKWLSAFDLTSYLKQNFFTLALLNGRTLNSDSSPHHSPWVTCKVSTKLILERKGGTGARYRSQLRSDVKRKW